MRDKAIQMIRDGKTTLEIVMATGISDRSVRRLRQKVRAGFVPGVTEAVEVPRIANEENHEEATEAFIARLRAAQENGQMTFEAITKAKLATAEKPAPTVEETVTARRQAAELYHLRKQNRQLQDALIEAQDFQAQAAILKTAKLEPVDWLPSCPHVRKQNVLTPILFTSDMHVGEVIRADELDGLNAYSPDIFCERYVRMIDKTISLAKGNTGATEFPGAVYLRGGDAISGEIHAELADTNDLSAIPAVRLAQRMEREGIRRLRDAFGRVRVISVPGNHGRTCFKPRAKAAAMHSYETLLSWWIASGFDGDDKVTFLTPPGNDSFFQVAGWNFLLTHGDKMGSKGGAGFVGPAATIARGHQKLFQSYAVTGRVPDVILTGHMHSSLQLATGFSNGALVGYSEYARDIRAMPDAPKQWLLFAHEKEKISHAFELRLGKAPRRDGIEYQA